MNAIARHQRTLTRAEPALEGLSPRLYRGPYPGAKPTDEGLTGEVARKKPELVQPWQLASVLGNVADLPTRLLMRQRDAKGALTDKYECQPILMLWPAVVPTVGNTSLLAYPVVQLAPGTYIYLKATWSWSSSTLGASNAQLVFTASNDLESNNDHSPFSPAGTTRTWTYNIGRIDPDGEFGQVVGFSSPFIPPLLR